VHPLFATALHRRRTADRTRNLSSLELAFHDADTNADILARIVARMSVCRSSCNRNMFRKSRVSDVSARILAKMSVSVSVSSSWNSSYIDLPTHAAGGTLDSCVTLAILTF